jgi:hypothetical protein
MNKTRFFTLLVSLLMILWSCETDFDITSEWKDITVVYGLIDQTDSVHLIKINKAFLGPGNALQYATVEDSSSYGNNLEVKLVEKRNGSLYDIFFDTTTMYQKDSGLFYYPHQVLYKSNAHLYPDAEYELNIRNKITGKVISAKTQLIDTVFDISYPPSGQSKIEFKRSLTSERNFLWTSVANGRRYQITVRFFFKESSASGDTIRSVEWVQSPEKSDNALGGEDMKSSYKNEQFFTTCINNIPYIDPNIENTVIHRQALRVDFIFTIIGDDINTYMEVNEPSNGVLQDKPEFTNITNGIGIFSCRTKRTRSKKLSDNTRNDLIKITNLKFE